MNGYRLGLDIGGTKTLGVLIDPEGTVRAITKAPTKQRLGVVDVADAVRRRCEELGGAIAETVGVGIPGVVAGGVVLHAVNLGITELPLAALLAERFGMPVAMGNDVKAAVLGARHALGGAADLAYVNFGTGVSAGCLIGGRLVEGHRHAAGEIGHLALNPAGDLCRCGQRGCVETMAGGRNIGRRLAQLEPSLRLTQLPAAAAAGHEGARAELATICAGIAGAVQALTLTVDPPTIVLGGGVVQGTPGLIDLVCDELARRAESSGFLASLGLADRLVTLDPGFPVGAYGAALLADLEG